MTDNCRGCKNRQAQEGFTGLLCRRCSVRFNCAHLMSLHSTSIHSRNLGSATGKRLQLKDRGSTLYFEAHPCIKRFLLIDFFSLWFPRGAAHTQTLRGGTKASVTHINAALLPTPPPALFSGSCYPPKEHCAQLIAFITQRNLRVFIPRSSLRGRTSSVWLFYLAPRGC